MPNLRNAKGHLQKLSEKYPLEEEGLGWLVSATGLATAALALSDHEELQINTKAQKRHKDDDNQPDNNLIEADPPEHCLRTALAFATCHVDVHKILIDVLNDTMILLESCEGTITDHDCVVAFHDSVFEIVDDRRGLVKVRLDLLALAVLGTVHHGRTLLSQLRGKSAV